MWLVSVWSLHCSSSCVCECTFLPAPCASSSKSNVVMATGKKGNTLTGFFDQFIFLHVTWWLHIFKSEHQERRHISFSFKKNKNDLEENYWKVHLRPSVLYYEFVRYNASCLHVCCLQSSVTKAKCTEYLHWYKLHTFFQILRYYLRARCSLDGPHPSSAFILISKTHL